MKREILCRECKTKQIPMHPQDVLDGIKRRIVQIREVKKPEGHGVTSNGVFSPLASIVCDHCAKPIEDGDEAFAVTWWNTNREGEPGPWEEDYT